MPTQNVSNMDGTGQHIFMRPATAAMRSERVAFNVFRLATYAVLLAATIIFGVIFIKAPIRFSNGSFRS
jgi:hypothetical protein